MTSLGRQFDFHEVHYQVQPCSSDNRRRFHVAVPFEISCDEASEVYSVFRTFVVTEQETWCVKKDKSQIPKVTVR